MSLLAVSVVLPPDVDISWYEVFGFTGLHVLAVPLFPNVNAVFAATAPFAIYGCPSVYILICPAATASDNDQSGKLLFAST